MNTKIARERAEERLLDAGLQERLGARVAPAVLRAAVLARLAEDDAQRAMATPRRWLTAALLLLGSCVAIGVAWLQVRDQRSANQEPQFDLPPWDQVGPPWTLVRGVEHLAHAGSLQSLGVSCSDAAIIEALRECADVERLLLYGDGNESEEQLGNALRMAASLPRMRCLQLSLRGDGELTARALRELRVAPALVDLQISRGAVLDADLAKALCELPKLRSLQFSSMRIDVAGMRALSGTPTLQALAMSQVDIVGTEDQLFAAVGELRMLRAFSLATPSRRPFAVRHVKLLSELPRLLNLDLGQFELDEPTLSQLPVRLEGLAIAATRDRGATASGLRSLRRLSRLKTLTIQVESEPEVAAAAAELVASLPRLERLCCRTGRGALQWSVVAAAGRVRELFVDAPRGDCDLSPCARLQDLEVLTLAWMFAAAEVDLGPLRGLTKLRRVVLAGARDLSEQQRQRLAGSLGPDVEVLFR